MILYSKTWQLIFFYVSIKYFTINKQKSDFPTHSHKPDNEVKKYQTSIIF